MLSAEMAAILFMGDELSEITATHLITCNLQISSIGSQSSNVNELQRLDNMTDI